MAGGSIQHRPDRPDRPWRARYRGPDGRERSRTFARKADAERWLRGQLGKLDRGDWVDPSAGRILYSEWLDRWQRQRLNLAAATRARDESLIRNHVAPAFGGRPLVAIRQEEVAGWVSELAAKLAPITVRKVYELFSASMEAAVVAERIARSPCRGIALPRLDDAKDMRLLEPADITDLADTIGVQYRAMVLLGGYAGMRWGEVAALRDRRVDLLRRIVRVEENLVDVKGHVSFKEPKTKASRRTLNLPSSLAAELAAHLEREGVGVDGLLFRAPEGGPLRRTGWARRVWAPAVAASIGGPLRFHDLRHTHAALLIAQGAHAKLVQERLGHTSIRTTLDLYGHLFEGLDREAADGLDALMRQTAPGRRAPIASLPHGD